MIRVRDPSLSAPAEVDAGPTLRDLFAAVAMHVILNDKDYDGGHDDRAVFAYEQADAMLAARARS